MASRHAESLEEQEGLIEYRPLLFVVLIISGCSMCYELIISALSTYLLGNSVLQYSVTIGLYMAAMGLGAYLSKFVTRRLFRRFAQIELAVGLLGGTSSLVLFLAHLYLHGFRVLMYALVILIGILVGAEIPILTRIVEGDKRHLRLTLSSIFSIDYVGGLIGAIAFPLLLLPKLGFFATSFLCGLINCIAASIVLWRYGRRIEGVVSLRVMAVVLMAVMAVGVVASDRLSTMVEGGLYRDHVIVSEQTPYQKIVLTRRVDDLRLFLDGNIQFCSRDEYRYHEALVHVPMAMAPTHSHVLVLGGGDGLAVREILKYDDVSDVTIVDIDPSMTELCAQNEAIVRLNEGSLMDSRVRVCNEDAKQFLQESHDGYDVVIIDLPDPNNEALNQLYTDSFYRLVGNHLVDNGVFVTQSTSPYFAREAFWCINQTIASEGFHVLPYHLNVPSFGEWGFNVASRTELHSDVAITVPTSYLTSQNVPALFSFGKDESKPSHMSKNTLNHPLLIEYYNKALVKWG